MFSRFRRTNFLTGLALTMCGAALAFSAEHLPESPVSPVGTPDRTTSIRVLWTVSSFHVMDHATWGEDEAGAMLFKPLDISATTITFDGRTCRDVVFDRGTMDTEQYFMERYRISPQTVGVEEQAIKVVRTNCRIPGFDEYARLDDGRLLVPMQGVLFTFTPAVND